MMEIWGATVHPSPSDVTEFGRAILAEDPDHPGIAGHRHLRGGRDGRRRIPTPATPSGRVLNHVLLHQTVIGQEAIKQLAKMADETPDIIIGCTGGGSNFAGLAFPFLREKLTGKMNPTIRCVEPTACPSAHQGPVPLRLRRHRGHDAAGEDAHARPRLHPRPIHAGGLRYHGMAPLVSHVYETGLVEAEADRPDRVLRGRGPVRPHRGHHAGAGADPRDRGRRFARRCAARSRARRR